MKKAELFRDDEVKFIDEYAATIVESLHLYEQTRVITLLGAFFVFLLEPDKFKGGLTKNVLSVVTGPKDTKMFALFVVYTPATLEGPLASMHRAGVVRRKGT